MNYEENNILFCIRDDYLDQKSPSNREDTKGDAPEGDDDEANVTVRFQEAGTEEEEGTRRKLVRSLESSYSGYSSLPRRHPSKYSMYSAATSLTSNGSILSTFGALVVLKIVFFDITISLGDAVTDILQGIYLVYWYDEGGNWELKETWRYGLGVLVVCWLPGLVCVIHILAHHRSDGHCSSYDHNYNSRHQFFGFRKDFDKDLMKV